jgi:hypothetical protein
MYLPAQIMMICVATFNKLDSLRAIPIILADGI